MIRNCMSPSPISIETMLSPSWRGAWTNYIPRFAVRVSHSTPTKQMQYYSKLPCVQKTISTLITINVARTPVALPDSIKILGVVLDKISPSTLTFLRFPNHVSTTFKRSAIYDEHSQMMLPKWSPAPLSAVTLTTSTRYSSAPRRKT